MKQTTLLCFVLYLLVDVKTIRKQVGKAVAVVGILAGLSALSGCGDKAKKVDNVSEEKSKLTAGEVTEPVVLDEGPILGGNHQLPIILQGEDPSKIFDLVEQMPFFPGGDKKLMEYLKENIRYPEALADSCVQGRVVCSFVVEKNGSISNVKVAKSLDPLLDEEAVRVVNSMPKWIPGRQNGVAYRVRYYIPVNFRLQ